MGARNVVNRLKSRAALIRWIGLAALAATMMAGRAESAPPGDQPEKMAAPQNDYSRDDFWLCRPGRPTDVCGRSDRDATVLQADGSARIKRFHQDPKAPVDCFYVYPTVSTAPGGNAPMTVEKAEVSVVNQQFARFAAVCRPFAPLYRQVTLTALRAGLRGQPIPTPFVAVPGLLSAECRTDGQHHYLAVTIHPTPGAARTNVITGDVVIDGSVRREWGLHIVDLNLTMGNLIDIVRAQALTYRKTAR